MSGQCEKCPVKFKRCEYDNLKLVVLSNSCAEGLFLIEGDCRVRCPSGYFKDLASFLCVKCNLKCMECLDETVDKCLECNSGFILTNKSTCVSCSDKGGFMSDCL